MVAIFNAYSKICLLWTCCGVFVVFFVVVVVCLLIIFLIPDACLKFIF